MEWSPADKLPADGYYAVNLAFKHQGEIWHDDTPWLKEPRWAMSQHRYLLDLSDDGWYLWSVRVMQKTGEDAEGKFLGVPLSPTSAERALVWRQPEVGRGNGGGKPTLAPP